MLCIFRKDRVVRAAGTVAAALTLFSTTRALSEGSTSEAVVLLEAGQPRRLEIARDELHFKDPSGKAWLQRVPAEQSVAGLRARAASLMAATGVDVKLVMYPSARPRNESTRRLLKASGLTRPPLAAGGPAAHGSPYGVSCNQ